MRVFVVALRLLSLLCFFLSQQLGRHRGFRCLSGGVLRRGTQNGPRGRLVSSRRAVASAVMAVWPGASA